MLSVFISTWDNTKTSMLRLSLIRTLYLSSRTKNNMKKRKSGCILVFVVLY